MKRVSVLLSVVTLAAFAVWGVVGLAVQPAAVSAAAEQTSRNQVDAAEAAAVWLIANHQNSDGGYASFSLGADQGDSSVNGTLDAVLGIAATGYNPAITGIRPNLSILDYFENNLTDMIAYANTSGGQAGKLVMGLSAMGVDPYNFRTINFVAILQGHQGADGAFDSTPYNQSLAIQGLLSAREAVPAEAVTWLVNAQEGQGSWTDGFGTNDNVDATAMALMTLVASGVAVTDTVIVSGTNFIAASQTATGGWGYDQAATFGENANSTGLVVQTLSALDIDFYSPTSTYAVSDTTPLDALLGYQGESGAYQVDFGTGLSDNFFATVQAMIGAAGRPFPLPARQAAAFDGIACLIAIQDPATSGWAQFGAGDANAAGTGRAIEALVAYGEDPTSSTWTISGTTPIDALESLAPAYMTNGGRVGTVMQAVVAAGGVVTDFAGFNLPISMTTFISTTGEYAPTNFGIYAHAEGMLGLLAAEAPVDPAALTVLNSFVITDDTWGENDQTGIALQVLAGMGETLPTNVLTTLKQTQSDIGGWNDIFGGFSINSTTEVVLGLTAVDDYPFRPAYSTVVDGVLTNAADVTIAQQAENGCWQPFGGDDAYTTTDAVRLLATDRVSVAPLFDPEVLTEAIFLPLMNN